MFVKIYLGNNKSKINKNSLKLTFSPTHFLYTCSNLDTTKEKKSKSCDRMPQFQAYDFSQVPMVTTFQSRSPSVADSGTLFPSVCMHKSFANDLFNVTVLFNDWQKVGSSSFFRGTTLKLDLYRLEYNVSNVTTSRLLAKTNKFGAETILTLAHLAPGDYLAELILQQNSSKCSLGECVIESTSSNTFECIKCKKLVIVLTLREDFPKRSSLSFRKCVLGNPRITHTTRDDHASLNKLKFECTSNDGSSLRSGSESGIIDFYRIVPVESQYEKLGLPYNVSDEVCDESGIEKVPIFIGYQPIIIGVPILIITLYIIVRCALCIITKLKSGKL